MQALHSMNRSEEMSSRSSRWSAVRQSSARLCAVAALAASCMALSARGARRPESSVPVTTTSPASSAELQLLWEARQALFVSSQPAQAHEKAAAVLRMSTTQDVDIRTEALFVEMESAVLQGDERGVTSTALQLCELRKERRNDPRLQIAAFRLAHRDRRMLPLQEVPAAQNSGLLAQLDLEPSRLAEPQDAVSQPQHLPPCQTRREAAKFFSRLAHYEKPSDIRQMLGRCAPDLLARNIPNANESFLQRLGRPVFLSR